MKQIKMRADRLGDFTDNLKIFCETDLGDVQEALESEKPDIAVIDSIQTMASHDVGSAPGSVSQIRESTNILMQAAKGLGIAMFIVGHVTKEGNVAGPRGLEHMVDTVLYFEGERSAEYRILRAVKNRFGSTNEIGVFEMKGSGLSEVKNPSEFMLAGKPEGTSGSIVTCSMEGTRPILVEIQGLVCRSSLGTPRRASVGTDYNRVSMLMAILEKKAGIRLSDCDSYVNIAGGLKISEPAIDLGIALAIASSAADTVIPGYVMAFGEVGLSGEIRSVGMPAQRISEAKKLGFKTAVVPASCRRAIGDTGGIEIIYVSWLKEAMEKLGCFKKG